MRVYVINQRGQALMPCKPQTAKRLLREGKAKAVRRTPFTIQLLVATGENKQEITLGVDAGSKEVGLSATTAKEVLFEGTVHLRTDIVKLLASRRALRSVRRNRKTRHRKARFLNRKRPKGWLAPSIQNKIAGHLKAVALVHKLLPIAKTIVEVASFDIQKINNSDIKSAGYQQGEQLGFWNVREYVLFRDGHRCTHCHGKSGDKVLNVHHIESRKTGGDSPKNLITLCEICHTAHHRGEIQLKVSRRQSFRDAAFMGIMRWAFYNKLKKMYTNVSLTYGYITKNTRIRLGLPKEHVIDARCISGNPLAAPGDTQYLLKAVRGQNRQLHKLTILKGGERKANKAPRYVKGFQLFDKVLYADTECFIFGRRSSGAFDLRLLSGTKVNAGASYKKLILLERATAMLAQRLFVGAGMAHSSPRINQGVSCFAFR